MSKLNEIRRHFSWCKIWQTNHLRRGGFTRTHIYVCAQCDCGGVAICRKDQVTSGTVRSCKCLLSESTAKRMTKHGACSSYKKSKEYVAWSAMMDRCYGVNGKHFSIYGGRGIIVCDRWHDFKNFFIDMGLHPGNRMSLDRIDVDGNYEPSNCRWATQSAQCNNTRRNVKFEINGNMLNFAQLSKIYGIPDNTINARVRRGWSIHEAISIPIGGKRVK